MPQLEPEPDLARLTEILEEAAYHERRVYLLVPHSRSVEFTGTIPYGVAEEDATPDERQRAILRVSPRGTDEQ